MIKYCAFALLALSAVLVMRGVKSEFASFAALASSAVLMGVAVVNFMPVLEYVTELVSDTPFSPYITTVIKAMGITLTAQLASEICKDSGEGALGAKLELVGKAEILILCLPLIGELVSLAVKIMEM